MCSRFRKTTIAGFVAYLFHETQQTAMMAAPLNQRRRPPSCPPSYPMFRPFSSPWT
ncbi:hypothetical protein FH063_005857 [Azospirillum argentinense]|uniref:Uncharacterized protein n=1 Tax=Azospirillum argentinense TaxID=2970906 RepID=A0A5B0KTU7_9PROT|nr:hypothetical protein FH063_005857 [Azospirillum argentinense]